MVSPILYDTEEDMRELEVICNVMQSAGLYTNEDCGGHIHIGASYLENNPKAIENFLTIWNECEETFYKMSNDVGEVPRMSINLWAMASHSDLEDFSNNGTVTVRTQEDFDKIRNDLIEKEKKNRGLNLGHFGEKGKNTIEFRIPNGTIDIKTLKENIKLYGKLMQVSKEMALNPEYKKQEYELLLKRDLTEREKVEALLTLLFDDEKDKSIYRNRWDSVKDEIIFEVISAGQPETFKRRDYTLSREVIKKLALSEEAITSMYEVEAEINREKEKNDENRLM